MFYSNNTFLIMSRRIKGVIKPKHIRDCDLPAHVLSSWLARIGAQQHLLQKIRVELDCLCEEDCKTRFRNIKDQARLLRYCRSTPHDFDVAGVTKVVWTQDLRADIKIVRTIMTPYGVGHQDATRFQVLDSLSQFLKAICEDMFDLRRYRLTIGAITLRDSGMDGKLLFWTTAEHEHAPRMARHVCPDTTLPLSFENGTNVSRPDGSSGYLVSSSQHLLREIFQYLKTNSNVLTLDLNSRADFRTVAGYAYTNTALRTLSLPHLTGGDFRLKMSTTSTRATFASMLKLERLLRTHVLCTSVGRNGRFLFGAHATFKIVLCFDLNQPAAFNDVRVEVIPFIIATLATWNGPEISIYIDLPTMSREETITVGLLRTKALTALRTHQDRPGSGGLNELCPEFWVNGQWQIVEIVGKGSAPLEARNVDVSPPPGLGPDDWVPGPPPYPSDGRLRSTIRYLEYMIKTPKSRGSYPGAVYNSNLI